MILRRRLDLHRVKPLVVSWGQATDLLGREVLEGQLGLLLILLLLELLLRSRMRADGTETRGLYVLSLERTRPHPALASVFGSVVG